MEARIKECKKRLKDAAYNWAMEDLHQNGAYNFFFDMLIGETDDRWLISSYLAVKFSQEDTRTDAIGSLGYFMRSALEYEELYQDYLEETRILLADLFPEDDKIKQAFELHDRIKALPENKRKLVELDDFFESIQ